MRIGIDARFYGPIGKGLGRYTERLIQNLEKVADDHEFVIFLRKENFDEYQPKSPRFRKVLADFGWYSLVEQIRFPSLMRREGIELMHFPHFNVPVLTPCPFIVTIHDLILFRYPTIRATTLHPVLYAFKYAAYRLTIGLAVRRAKKIIAVSEFTKNDLLKTFRLSPDRVAVTYEAAELPEVKSQKSKVKSEIRKAYFLYVGNAYPHKNLEALLRAFKDLRDDHLDAQLVLVGKSDYFYDRLRAEADRLGLLAGNDAIFYGYADDAELETLYRNARAYVFPSLFEGFGLPPLEAMLRGTPVVSSNATCLPEILGDAAAYFDPKDRNDMRRAMKAVFQDEALRERLIASGTARVARYDWATCAKQTYALYHAYTR